MTREEVVEVVKEEVVRLFGKPVDQDLAMEKLKKDRADRQLVEERIETEKVEQMVKKAGMENDKARLRMEEKRVDAEIAAWIKEGKKV